MVAEELQLEVPKPQQPAVPSPLAHLLPALPEMLWEVAVAQPSCHHRPASPVPLPRLAGDQPEQPGPTEAEVA